MGYITLKHTEYSGACSTSKMQTTECSWLDPQIAPAYVHALCSQYRKAQQSFCSEKSLVDDFESDQEDEDGCELVDAEEGG